MTDRPTVATPFALSDGRVLRVELPAEGLAPAEADRLCAVIRAWTIPERDDD